MAVFTAARPLTWPGLTQYVAPGPAIKESKEQGQILGRDQQPTVGFNILRQLRSSRSRFENKEIATDLDFSPLY